MRRLIRENGLSIVMAALFVVAVAGQAIAGQGAYNEEQLEHGRPTVGLAEYVTTGHFGSALFENWESEFLQMGLFVVLTVFLRQKGSPESKPLDGDEAVDREPSARRRGAPWPVRAGGLVGRVYANSLSLALFGLFGLSFALHVATSAASHGAEQVAHGEPPESVIEHLGSPTLWFESFQNWQSEFMSIAALAVLAIFLRQKGSPESKPVDAPHDETGSA